MTDTHRTNQSENNEHRLNLDEIVTSQPELGPSIPDGGCGWLVFVGSLFFQALIPCMIVNFGVFLAFSKLEHGTADDKNMMLWDDKLLYVPLFFSISRSFFDSPLRALSTKANSARLVAVLGTCLTCSGLLFMWMGMTGDGDYWLFVLAGIFSGFGATTILVQCEILVAQYFRLKLPILNQISQFTVASGFLLSPIVLGHYILHTSTSRVLLWYQAIIIQGLVVSLVFRKPWYLKKAKTPKPYHFVMTSQPDDEEDIFSKNSRELQIKRQGKGRELSTIQIHNNNNNNEPQPSTSTTTNPQKEWEKFDEEEDEGGEEVKYSKLDDWEVFDEEDQPRLHQKWDTFDKDGASPRIVNDLSLAEETKDLPSPLFSHLPVNNNNTYAYDEDFTEPRSHDSNVFEPNNTLDNQASFKRRLDLLKEATFYKSLLTVVSNTYSSFVFYALFPSYLYIQADSLNISHMTVFLGTFALVNLIYLSVSYWIPVKSQTRPLWLWPFFWIGSVGYFMIADFTNEYVLLFGGVQIVLSLGVLENVCRPLLGVSVKGETSNEYCMLSMVSAFTLFLFFCMDVSFKTCFRLMAVLHFFTGTLWLSNYAYKKLRAF